VTRTSPPDRRRPDRDRRRQAHSALQPGGQTRYDQAYFVWLLNIEDIYGVSKRLAWPGRVDAKMLVSEMKVK
jgi:peptide/nickel transport system substrate-binding protein